MRVAVQFLSRLAVVVVVVVVVVAVDADGVDAVGVDDAAASVVAVPFLALGASGILAVSFWPPIIETVAAVPGGAIEVAF
jgi:hypothetical protein